MKQQVYVRRWQCAGVLSVAMGILGVTSIAVTPAAANAEGPKDAMDGLIRQLGDQQVAPIDLAAWAGEATAGKSRDSADADLGASADGGETIAGPGLPSGQTFLLYAVDLSGTSQGVAFRSQGHLVLTGTIDRVRTRNGTNPLDAFLVTGTPFHPAASAGTISYATNSGFDELRSGANAAARLDGAYVSYDARTKTLDVQPDPGVAAALSLNNFTGRGGLLGDVYLVKGGRMLIRLSSDARTLTGAADLLGTGYIYHSNTPYRAQISGRYLGQGQFQ